MHQKRAKYCLIIRNKENDNSFQCICGKSYTSKENLEYHQKKCKEGEIESLKTEIIKVKEEKDKQINHLNDKYEKSIKEQHDRYEKTIKEQHDRYEKTIKELQDKLENIAIKAVSRPTNTIKNTQNNYIQQLQPITEQNMKDNAENLTIEHILKGAQGYAEYALTYPLKDRIACVDYARRKIKFKDQDGNVITDPEMNNLSTKFFDSIKDKNTEIIIDYGNKFKDNFENNVEKILELMDYKYSVDKGAGGKKEDFHHDFIRQVCNKTIVHE